MGCSTLSKPAQIHVPGAPVPSVSAVPSPAASVSKPQHGAGALSVQSTQGGTPPVTPGRTRERVKRASSGIEGRYGFVQSNRNSIEASRVHSRHSPQPPGIDGDTRSSRPSGHGHGQHRITFTEGLNHALQNLIHGKKGGGESMDDDPSKDVPEIDVVFIFKKALEVKRDVLLTADNISDILMDVIHELDPQSTGSVTRGALIGYIQATCVFSNMVKPSHEQIVSALKQLNLESNSQLECGKLHKELLCLHWGLLPVVGGRAGRYSESNGFVGAAWNPLQGDRASAYRSSAHRYPPRPGSQQASRVPSTHPGLPPLPPSTSHSPPLTARKSQQTSVSAPVTASVTAPQSAPPPAPEQGQDKTDTRADDSPGILLPNAVPAL